MYQSGRRSVAFVTPRYGAGIYGGAEHLCRSFAEHLTRTHDVDVITTRARDYRTWRNEFAAGESTENGVVVRRFGVDRPRNPARFDRLSHSVRDAGATLPLRAQERWMREQGPYSPELLRFLDASAERYDALVFLPYLYATTYFGLPRAAKRSILMPLAHDEWPIKLSAWNAIFTGAAARVFMTEEERAFVLDRFGPHASGGLVSAGVDAIAGDANRFAERTGISDAFGLYVGRVDASKGCDTLAADFAEYRRTPGSLQTLVMAGPGAMLPARPGLIQLGEIDEQLKWDAYAACSMFIMPSAFESFSFALLEAWASGKPALVNSRAKVLVDHCRRSNGGLWYGNAAEFSAAARTVMANGPVLGEQGRRYVEEFFSWNRSCEALAAAVEAVTSAAGPALR